MPWTPPPAPTSLSQHLALIVESLCGAVARRSKDRSIPPALIILAWTRLRRLSARFEALMAKIDAGRLRLRVARVRERSSPQRSRPPGSRQPHAALELPRGFGWLIRLSPETIASR